jgi:hypothetical protein
MIRFTRRSMLRATGGLALMPLTRLWSGTREATMDIKRSGSQPSTKGPAEWFTGTVRIDPLFDAPPPARAAGASVTFEPGARTAWHTHPLGQTLIVTAGFGRAALGRPSRRDSARRRRMFPPGEKSAYARKTSHCELRRDLAGAA